MKPIRVLMISVAMLIGTSQVHAADPKATIADLDARLAKIGAPRLEGMDKVGDKEVPAIFFGQRKINNNFDVVDAIRKDHKATATVFVKSGDEFVRVSTNVLTPEGKRGIGTQLARNAAYEAVSKGQQYCGPIDVLGTAFAACYNPIRVAGGAIIGVSVSKAAILAGAMAVLEVVQKLAAASTDGDLTSEEIKEAFNGKKK